MNKLINKVLLIIDNQSSISQHIAHLASKEGATVLIAYSSSLSDTFTNHSSITESFKQDTHSLKGWFNLIKQIKVKYNKIDILVTLNIQNFPSLFSPSNNLNINLYSSQIKDSKQLKYISKTIIPWMELTGGGSIVRVSSTEIFDTTDVSFLTDFEPSDHFIQKNIRNYAKKNIRINTICPSIVNTPLLEYNITSNHYKFESHVSIPYFTNNTDVATTVIYLSCDESSFITGGKLILNEKNSLLNN